LFRLPSNLSVLTTVLDCRFKTKPKSTNLKGTAENLMFQIPLLVKFLFLLEKNRATPSWLTPCYMFLENAATAAYLVDKTQIFIKKGCKMFNNVLAINHHHHHHHHGHGQAAQHVWERREIENFVRRTQNKAAT
jgi:hypothetical protein